jgi:sulfite exporter TauE/SafE
MCGPFVLSQTATALDEMPLREVSDFTRLRGAALLPYHTGRLTTYAVMGILATEFSAHLRALPWFNYLTCIMLVLAGLLFLISALPFLRPRFAVRCDIFPSTIHAHLQRLFAQPRGWRGYLLGLLLGLLPCGLVYAAILSVAARGDVLTAVAGMIVFGLGTVPVLVAVGICGQFAFHRFRAALRYVFPVLMMMNSLALFAMAGDLLR